MTDPTIRFQDLGLNPDILKALSEMGFETPTPVQAAAVPHLIGSDQDMLAFAQTGTGKTAGFGLPILHNVDTKKKGVQYLILSPTRELCLQISSDIKKYGKYMKDVRTTEVYGGADIVRQIRELERGAHIVVGTPGRVRDLINRKKLKLGDLRGLVLDEADEMLMMGFKEELDEILQSVPDQKQTLMFSATMNKEVKRVADKYLTNPKEVSVAKVNTANANVKHVYYQASARDRYQVLRRIADMNPDIYAIVFCRTRREAKDVAGHLMGDHYNADSLHGDLSQSQRDEVMKRFRDKRLQILVATDVAARGLDVKDLTHAINYNLPDDSEVYTHRSGRTGRAGKKGISIAIVHSKEMRKIRDIQKFNKIEFEVGSIPSGKDICQAQLMNLVQKISTAEVDTKQISPYLDSIEEAFAELSKEDIIQKMVSVEFGRFLQAYKGAKDLNQSFGKPEKFERKSKRDRDRDSGIDYETLAIDFGRNDNMNPQRMIGIINNAMDSNKVAIGRINIQRNRTEVDVDARIADKVSGALDTYINSPKFEADMKKPDRSGGGRPGGRGGFDKRSGGRGDFKKRGSGARKRS